MKFLKPMYLFLFSSLFLSSALCFPRDIYFLSFIFLIPIIFFTDNNNLDFSKKKDVFKVFFMMFFFGFLFAIFSSVWVFSMYPLDWMNLGSSNLSFFIILSVIFFYGIIIATPTSFWIIFVYALKKSNLFFNAIIGASAWVFLEYTRSIFALLSVYGQESLFGPHYTNYSIAYSVFSVPVIKELLPVGGIYMTSFVVILINYFIYYSYLVVNNKTNNKNQIVFLGIIIVVITLFSSLYMREIREKDINRKEVIVSVVNTYLPASTSVNMEKLRRSTAINIVSKISTPHGIVVLPENLNIINPFNNITNEGMINKIKRNHLIIGSTRVGDYYAMYFFNPQNNDTKYYAKQLLMPIGEYSISWVRFLIKLTNNKEWLSFYDKSTSMAKKGNGIFLYNDEKNNVVISGGLCSENISPYIYRNETRAGASFLVNLSSRSDFHDGSPLLSRQTLAINTVRALENGRYLVTATNKDKSFVITDTGNIQDMSTTTEISSYFNSKIIVKDYITPFVRYGDYIVVISIATLIIGMVLSS